LIISPDAQQAADAKADEVLFSHATLESAFRNLRNILSLAIQYTPEQAALVVHDSACPLAEVLTSAYRYALPNAVFIDFDEVEPDEVLAEFAALQPDDLVVLVQSTNFRLEAFRIRVELFKRGLKVIEHPHLSRMPGQESLTYIEALAYDPEYYRGVGHALKARIDGARSGVIDSGGGHGNGNGNGGERLIFGSAFEPAKLNIGDYSGMKNVGGQFPIGEVFTEARDLEAVNGRVRIAVFGDTSFRVNRPPQPITLVIERGRVVEAIDSTPEFEQVLVNIRADEGEVWLRELGFGMNRALTHERTVSDIGTYERMCGIHLSLGAKHGVYSKPEIRRAAARYHIDVFAMTETVLLDDAVVYRDGAWTV
jgi:aminopeptidase